jgi:hypothetical protein
VCLLPTAPLSSFDLCSWVFPGCLQSQQCSKTYPLLSLCLFWSRRVLLKLSVDCIPQQLHFLGHRFSLLELLFFSLALPCYFHCPTIWRLRFWHFLNVWQTNG